MIGSDLLDAAIGVIFVILTFSLLASACQEALAGLLNLRGQLLRRAIFRMLDGAGGGLPWLTRSRIRRAELAVDVLQDPVIRVLHGPRSLLARLWDWLIRWRRDDAERLLAGLGRLPAAIPADSFAQALIESLARRIDLSGVRREEGLSSANIGEGGRAVRKLVADLAREADHAIVTVRALIAALPLGPAAQNRLVRALRDLSVGRAVAAQIDRLDERTVEVEAEAERLLSEAEDRIKLEAEVIERWFDRTMDGLSEWYAQRTRIALFAIGAGMALAVNIDFSTLAGRFSAEPAFRAEMIERAVARSEMPLERVGPSVEDPVDHAAGTIEHVRDELVAMPGHGGTGFTRNCHADEGIAACLWRTTTLGALVSWLLIGLGCMMGGQFWYDALGAVVRLRPVAGARRPA